MTPAQKAKSAGLKSLLQVSELTGVSIQTLSNWAKDKPLLFGIALSGCVVKSKQDNIMKNRIKVLKAQVTASILELGESPVSVCYSDLDKKSLQSVLDDAAVAARDAINNAFVEELNV